MLRRFLSGKSFTDADRGHFHHQLMKRFGHGPTVLIIYGITMAFGISAYIYILNRTVGFAVIICLLIAMEIFIERTHMISEKYHPILSLIDKIMGKNLKDDK